MKLKKFIALLLALVMALSVAACNPGSATTSNEPSGTGTASTEPGSTGDDGNRGSISAIENFEPGTHGLDWRDYTLADEQVLDIVLSVPSTTTLDPNDSTGATQWEIFQMVGEGLFRVYGNPDGTQTMEPAGCESYEVSDDNLTYTFHLRDNTWSDGKPVTSADYAYSLRRLLDPEEAFGYAEYMWVLKNADAYYHGEAGVTVDDIGIATPDDKTLVLTVEQPTPYFLEEMGMVPLYPIRQDVLEAAPDEETWQTDYTYHVFNGPFVISDRVMDNSITLTPNPYYWDAENIKLTQINLLTVSEQATQALMFENGELDILDGTAEFVDRWQAAANNGEYIMGVFGRPQTGMIYFNEYDHEPGYPGEDDVPADRPRGGSSGLMLSEKCRLAISLSIDRQAFLDTVYNRYTVAGGFIPKGMECNGINFRETYPDDYITNLQAQYDTPEKLRALFEEGMAEAGVSGTVSDVTLKLMNSSTTSLAATQIEFLQQNIQDVLGVTVELKNVDSSVARAERNSGDWDMMVYSWIGDYNDPGTFTFLYTSTSGYYNTFGGFNDEEYDHWHEVAMSSTDPQERAEAFQKAEEILVTKAGVAPLYYGDQIEFTQTNVRNVSWPQVNPVEVSRAFIVADDAQ